MKLTLIIEKLWLCLVLAPLAFGIWYSLTWFRSAVLFEQSQIYQEAWTELPETLSVENWRTAGQDLFSALTLNPGNSEYLHQYGLLLDSERRLTGELLTREQRQQILANAIETHRLGIRQQPSNPFGWAYFARAKALAGEHDGAFDLALQRINNLGPWEKDIQLMLAGIAQFYWDDFSENGKFYSRDILQRALTRESYDEPLVRYLKGSDFLPMQLCPLIDRATLTELAQEACQPQ